MKKYNVRGKDGKFISKNKSYNKCIIKSNKEIYNQIIEEDAKELYDKIIEESNKIYKLNRKNKDNYVLIDNKLLKKRFIYDGDSGFIYDNLNKEWITTVEECWLIISEAMEFLYATRKRIKDLESKLY